MEYQIQQLVFPTETKHQQCRDLFYHGDSGYLDREKSELHLSSSQKCDFVTYINAFSNKRWKEYSIAGKVSISLEISGKVNFCFLGYHKDLAEVVRNEFSILTDDREERRVFRFDFPENDEQMIGFEITALDDCCIYGGSYAVECDPDKMNDVCLCIAMTTCKKETFVKKNVALLKNEIIALHDDMAEHFYVHVVDNGRTLTDEDIYGEHIFLHPNTNCGGSGGFARGMLESLHQDPEATHVLLMDDDVLVLPESLRRTYNLLKLLKPKYKNDFISGAMLYYEEPNRQHEDIGTVTKDCSFLALKPKFDHNLLVNNLDNESDFLKQDNEYAGWWYCCIPASVIKKNGLPLPLFIRCDDMEYSLRCKANILTMNGICVWHMGFVTKYNAAFDKYQQCRNLMIDNACFNVFKNVDVYDFVRKSYRIELLKFNYNAAELIIRALKDYCKGPDILRKNNGEEIVQENSKLNDKMIPLSEIKGGNLANVWDCYSDEPRKFLSKWIFRLTYNGQRFFPDILGNNKLVPIAFDHSYQPGKEALHNRLLAVNPYNKTGIIRKKDKKRYRQVQKEYREVISYYNSHRKAIDGAWKEVAKELVSQGFWINYLNEYKS